MLEKKQPPLVHEFFLRYAGDIKRFLTWKVGEDDAADLTQQVYLRALEHSNLGTVRQPRAFLLRIAANLVVDTYRWRKTRAPQDDAPLPNPEEIQEPAPGPEARVSGHMELQRFRSLLAELPAPSRHAFLLNRVDGLTHAEIAERLGISRKSVERHILKALRYLQDRMAD
ncbi:RNA polymerase sigma factor [Methylococcus sp. EFPC2]|uniref:RNA polymerase sigma factor n=1 Tax=Methylococcus sp. EFPC2 TaxID=2812648 RepID=UPI0019683693|nr:sigma-70 family RNA polymerase sigma factor [Methylococcus sp. EFPC2]QSA96013.1 sigma-70 family RNA polymerase sigma factor [Methylococcus sp. EFPC2]